MSGEDTFRGCQPLTRAILRYVQIARQGDAVTVLERDFLVLHLLALGEGLVPFLAQVHVGPLACSVIGSNEIDRRAQQDCCANNDRAPNISHT
jgi:hypothetical protein